MQDLFETCTICNAKCGKCSEDCKYCSQSAHHSACIDEYPLISREEMLRAAGEAAAIGSNRYGIVTSGRGLDDAEVSEVAAAISGVARRGISCRAPRLGFWASTLSNASKMPASTAIITT